VADVAERYMAERAEPYMKRTTVVGYRSLLRRHLLPALGSMKVTAIDRQDVIRFHTKIGETPKAVPKADAKRKRSKATADQARPNASETTRGAANRARSLLSAVLAAAEEWGLRPVGTNPCHGTPKFRERRVKRYLTSEERARLETALCESERATKGQKAYVCRGSIDAVRLLSLTGARKSEITGLQWSMVDLDRGELRLSDSKTGEKVIPVSSNAVELLRQLEARRDPAVPWVCPGEQGKRLHNLPRAWESLRHRAGLDDVRLHDLRHSFASDALAAGVPLAVVGAMLGHKRVETTARYTHLDDKVTRAGVETTGAKIEASMREGAERLQQRAVGDSSGGEGGHREVIPVDGGAKVIALRPRGKR
jgi:integrase